MVIVVTEKHQNNCFIQVKPPFSVVELSDVTYSNQTGFTSKIVLL